MEPITITDQALLKRVEQRILFVRSKGGPQFAPIEVVSKALDRYLTKMDYYSVFHDWKRKHGRQHWKKQRQLCFYCQKFVPYSEVAFDHKHPISRGGAVADPENIAVSCRECNEDKDILTADEYRYKQLANASLKKAGSLTH